LFIKIILFVVFITTSLFAIVEETADFRDFLYRFTEECEYDNWISHVSEGLVVEDYNLYAPWDRQTNGFGDFRTATIDELYQWANVVDAFLSGQYQYAQTLIDNYGFPYNVVEFNDTETGRTYYMLREILNMDYFDDNGFPDNPELHQHGSFDYGWGLYVHNPDAENPILVSVVHPKDDFIAPPVSYESFRDWDAQFLMIAGAGREVKWTEQGNYTNGKSLSDPSRVELHAFNVGYQRFADYIRSNFGRIEYSVQWHSCDWNRHLGIANNQMSAGYPYTAPGLPIRDLSDNKLDFINAADHVVIPENTIGENEQMYINDYYTVYYDEYDFYYSAGVPGDKGIPVNNQLTLPGYSQNRQMIYTIDGRNPYDVFSPFLHIEMDELPESYELIEENYLWFYAYDFENETFDMESLFDKTLEYYTPMVDHIWAVLPEALELDDGLGVETPQNLEVEDEYRYSMRLRWDKVSSYDFYSYEILIADEPIGANNYEILSRETHQNLASQAQETIMITGLDANQKYYFQIRGRDYNGNYSDLSEEIMGMTTPAIVTQFRAVGRDEKSSLSWRVNNQSGNEGFNVYRKTETTDYVMIDSWETNDNLVGGTGSNVYYYYDDEDVTNGKVYTYRLSMVNTEGFEYFISATVSCAPNHIFPIYVNTQDQAFADTLYFGVNHYASDDYESEYDILKGDYPQEDYLMAAFFLPPNTYLEQDIKAVFDPINHYKTWKIRVKTDQLDQSVGISLDESFFDDHQIYLRNDQTDEFTNMINSDLYFHPIEEEYYEFTLYWGKLYPNINFATTNNQILQAGEVFSFSWNIMFGSLVEYLSISLQNDSDSLLIAQNLPGTVREFDWEVEDDITMHNAQVVIDLTTFEGEQSQSRSSYRVGVLPAQLSMELSEGWQTRANPWPDFPINVASQISPNAVFYSYDENQQYQSEDYFEFETGYMSYVPNEFTVSEQTSVHGEQLLIPMHPGWNLIANPYPYTLDIRDIRYILNESNFTFHSMVMMRNLARSLFVYSDGRYEMASEISPYESFYIYSHSEDADELYANFIPYLMGPNTTELDINWIVHLQVEQASSDRDNIVLGVSPKASSSFDFHYDMPKPPHKPFDEAISVYFPKDPVQDSLFAYQELHWEFLYPFVGTSQQSKYWELEIEVPTDEAIELHPLFMNVPDNYTVKLYIDGNEYDIIHNNMITIDPTEAGIISGEIEVKNYTPVNADDILTIKQHFSNYPNPFNPETTITFYIPKHEQVKLDIYNIRGQKVKTLVDEPYESGIHQIVWEGKDKNDRRVSSGVYIYRLQTESYTATKKMMLLK
jgi:hypothetical protein